MFFLAESQDGFLRESNYFGPENDIKFKSDVGYDVNGLDESKERAVGAGGNETVPADRQWWRR